MGRCGSALLFKERRENTFTSYGVALAHVVVYRNIFEIDPHAIGDTKVVTTIAGGKTVYEADNP